MDVAELEVAYQRISQNLPEAIPDGITPVDIELLQRLNLLDIEPEEPIRTTPITHYFHVMETPDKITLFNDRFVVWIVPDIVDNIPTTYTLIGLRTGSDLHLELAFSTTGIYNTSRLVLRVLEKFLMEIDETQTELSRIEL